MKTLKELKREMDDARADWEAAYDARLAALAAADWDAAFDAAWDAWCDARVAYHKRLKEVENEDA